MRDYRKNVPSPTWPPTALCYFSDPRFRHPYACGRAQAHRRQFFAHVAVVFVGAQLLRHDLHVVCCSNQSNVQNIFGRRLPQLLFMVALQNIIDVLNPAYVQFSGFFRSPVVKVLLL